jgi:lipoate---protein ligase
MIKVRGIDQRGKSKTLLRIINSPSNIGTYNLVLEKYLVDNLKTPTLLVWRNRPGVYIGRHQNTYDEIDEEYVEAQGFEVFRRLSGGGTIFHDEYNVYYSFMFPNTRTVTENFAYFNNHIVDFLHSVGVQAERSGRNDILVGGRKISGSAEHYSGNNVVHHGSLLFATDIIHMAPALTPNKQKFTSKAITSVAQRVDNIINHVDLTVEQFVQSLISYFTTKFEGTYNSITQDEHETTMEMIRDYYGTFEWNYGKSPAFTHTKEMKYPFGIVEVNLSVKDGIIKDMKILGDFFHTQDLSEIEQHFIGVRYQKKVLDDVIEAINVPSVIVGATAEDLLNLIW